MHGDFDKNKRLTQFNEKIVVYSEEKWRTTK